MVHPVYRVQGVAQVREDLTENRDLPVSVELMETQDPLDQLDPSVHPVFQVSQELLELREITDQLE